MQIQLTHFFGQLYCIKEAKKQFDFDKLGKYFSALSNEANLNNKSIAWLVLGVKDKLENGVRPVVGTLWRRDSYDKIKYEMSVKTNSGITFRNIYEIYYKEKRILMFEISACENGIPVAYDGQYYARSGESLTALSR